MIDLKESLAKVRQRIDAAARRAGRDPREITLVAVSKTQPAASVWSAIEAGCTTFGENKVQEGEDKIAEIGRDKAAWHLIGHLQSNKAKRAVAAFDVIETADSIELARRLERYCLEAGRAHLSIFVQVDLAGEESKSGVNEAGLAELTDYLSVCKHLRFDGLMTLPPYFEDPELARPFFKRLRELRDQLKDRFASPPGHLSMGMSHDFEVAIEEGATVVRVGTAIFGKRNAAIVPVK